MIKCKYPEIESCSFRINDNICNTDLYSKDQEQRDDERSDYEGIKHCTPGRTKISGTDLWF
jgi:hypothetical protein